MEERIDLQRGGIYQIVNRENGKIYVGSSANMEKRIYEHKRLLFNGKHDNTHMQNCINKLKRDKQYEKDDFEKFFYYGCIEYIDDLSERMKKEQEYIDLLYDKSEHCYNQSPFAVWRERVFSNNPEETRRRLSLAGKKSMQNPEYKEKMKDTIRRTVKTEKWIRKMKAVQNNPEIRKRQTETKIKNGLYKPFFVISSEGEVCYVEVISSFSKLKGISGDKLSKLRREKIKSSNGYRLYIGPDKLRESNLLLEKLTSNKLIYIEEYKSLKFLYSLNQQKTALKLIFAEKTNKQLDGVEKDAKPRMRKNARKRQSTIKCS